MWPDRVSNPGPLTYESGALSAALRGPAKIIKLIAYSYIPFNQNLTKNLISAKIEAVKQLHAVFLLTAEQRHGLF